MKQGKYAAKRTRKQSKKPLVLLMALMLVVGVAVGGTVAWLTADSGTITNTFKTSDIAITLSETKPENKTAQIVPGYTITKDPKVTVTKDSEKCYVFVTVTENNWPAVAESEGGTRKVDYTVITGEDGWTMLENSGAATGTTVYYRVVNKGESDQEFKILDGDKVTISSTLTKTEMAAITNDFTLTFNAYACQYYKNNTATDSDTNGTAFTASEAWNNCKPSNFGS